MRLGFSLNLMTVLALSLVVGILVDDALVVLKILPPYGDGQKQVRAAYDAVSEIGMTVTSITLVHRSGFPANHLQMNLSQISSVSSVYCCEFQHC